MNITSIKWAMIVSFCSSSTKDGKITIVFSQKRLNNSLFDKFIFIFFQALCFHLSFVSALLILLCVFRLLRLKCAFDAIENHCSAMLPLPPPDACIVGVEENASTVCRCVRHITAPHLKLRLPLHAHTHTHTNTTLSTIDGAQHG